MTIQQAQRELKENFNPGAQIHISDIIAYMNCKNIETILTNISSNLADVVTAINQYDGGEKIASALEPVAEQLEEIKGKL